MTTDLRASDSPMADQSQMTKSMVASMAASVSASVPASALVLLSTSSETPRPSTAPQPLLPPQMLAGRDDPAPPTRATPTRANFAVGGLASQKPLPMPFPTGVQTSGAADMASKMRRRANSQHSRKSMDSEDVDVDMDGSDGDTALGEDAAGSDEDSVFAAGSRTGGKKKKSQRFYCTEYPPCSLSFTRSEHLARHIRKHTGERPFQCHCHRRFSRLDNLRQHAQTVHVNEDIPIDSLAATGSRFQRPVRNERVRQPARVRAGSLVVPPRAHTKSLSTSNIGTMAYGPRNDDIRRRPPPLLMSEPFPQPSRDHAYGPPSPTDYATPSSATFSTDHGSPRWGSGLASPISTPHSHSHSHSRSHSMYALPSRRLSVPSSASPFPSLQNIAPGRLMGIPDGLSSSHSAVFMQSPGLSTPTRTSMMEWPARRDLPEGSADESWRRRTWHPDSRQVPNSAGQLADVVTPTRLQPNPAAKLPYAIIPADATKQGAGAITLPGIESFGPLLDDCQPDIGAPSPRQHESTPMLVDPESGPLRQPVYPIAQGAADDQRNLSQGDARLRRGFNKLDITTPPPNSSMRLTDSAGRWANEAREAVLTRGERVRLGGANPLSVRFEQQLPTKATLTGEPHAVHRHQTLPASSIASPRERRQAWYHGPLAMHSRNDDDDASEVRSSVGRMTHPNMDDHSAPFSLRQAQQPQMEAPRRSSVNEDAFPTAMDKLVAVATNAAY